MKIATFNINNINRRLPNLIDWLMIHSVDPFAHYNVASVHLPEYSGWSSFVYLLYYAPLLILVVAKPKRWIEPLLIAQVLVIAVLIVHPFSAVADGKLRVDFLDVAQGDAALVTLPDGRTLLVDGGGNTNQSRMKTDKRSIGEAVVTVHREIGICGPSREPKMRA